MFREERRSHHGSHWHFTPKILGRFRRKQLGMTGIVNSSFWLLWGEGSVREYVSPFSVVISEYLKLGNL